MNHRSKVAYSKEVETREQGQIFRWEMKMMNPLTSVLYTKLEQKKSILKTWKI